LRAFGSGFLIFTDYARGSIRLSSIMEIPALHVWTHDTISLGEDGPTHQPIEQLSTLRAIPGFTVLRPADANEAAIAWRVAVEHANGPVGLALTRQKVPFIDRTKYGSAEGVAKGAYVLADPPGGAAPRVVLMSSGSEVQLVMKAQDELAAKGIPTRTVSMPSMELFAQQTEEYRAQVLPPGVPRVAIEAAHPMSWYKWVGLDGVVIGLEHFGASAKYEQIYEGFGITTAAVVEAAERLAAQVPAAATSGSGG
ncbi:MAG: transketolase-like TK C-terminal-containing protein, partial [Gemmatimonadaceae bacterium]